MKIKNGAKIISFFAHRQTSVMVRPWLGVILAETDTDWVTWRCYSDDGENFDCESGHYFNKLGVVSNEAVGATRQKAEIDFGARIAEVMTANQYRGLHNACEPNYG